MNNRKLQIALWGYGIGCLLLIVAAFRYWGPSYGAIASFWFLIFVLTITSIGFLLYRQQWRISLRTLLIATTAVAFVLGLIVYVTRG